MIQKNASAFWKTEFTKTEKQNETNNKDSLRDVRDNIKQTKIHILYVSKRNERENEQKTYWKK